jgi:ATP-dependent Lhr-like helicase
MGRWSVLSPESLGVEAIRSGSPEAVERIARQLLHRYGVVFRDLLARESCAPPWRELLAQYRRMEFRGELRGGRFVAGFTGEQFALPEAVEAIRAVRRQPGQAAQELTISASDPLNLVGILTPGQRTPATAGSSLTFRGGVHVLESHNRLWDEPAGLTS